ncbi:LytR C-terminal domain-containing protein [Chitinivibrio alkaliphilus]|uniref:LytR/CpsA/Psr regulator C-terminal domain-containing protein n=1 Tax=Chitinivibrio alkaliphilus ACht1 TaxID=1313304 RepID=U7D3I8_9BACT|nr:LytR C-terminal domain-containing protein [Chitinivibrio alkaliphilus]ERP31069.1 hypothetical protein CALK_2027 [Chitinivibrio alkaliphilus ACht1]
MKTGYVLSCILTCLVLISAFHLGEKRFHLLEEQREHQRQIEEKSRVPESAIPRRGSVEILNGCGTSGVAGAVAELLRREGFRTTEGNARSWNYSQTIVVQRKAGTDTAEELANLLGTPPPIFIRPGQGDARHDATLIVGHDYERIIYDF